MKNAKFYMKSCNKDKVFRRKLWKYLLEKVGKGQTFWKKTWKRVLIFLMQLQVTSFFKWKFAKRLRFFGENIKTWKRVENIFLKKWKRASFLYEQIAKGLSCKREVFLFEKLQKGKFFIKICKTASYKRERLKNGQISTKRCKRTTFFIC